MSGQRILKLLLLVGVVVGTGFAVHALNDPQRRFKESGKHPVFELEGRDAPMFTAKVMGAEREFTREDVDKPTLFVFFGTFCPHCKEMMPTTKLLADEFAGRAHVYAVNAREYANMPMDEREKRVTAYLDEHGFTGLPTLLAPTQMQSALSIGAVPTVMVLDSTRKISYVGLAAHSAYELRRRLNEVK